VNPYHVITVRADGVNRGCAHAFSSWIREPGTQSRIERFGIDEYGEPLFVPDTQG
jgi:tungstate transport system substrate-binding protein